MSNIPEFSVSELSSLTKNLLEEKKYYATLSGDSLFKGNKRMKIVLKNI